MRAACWCNLALGDRAPCNLPCRWRLGDERACNPSAVLASSPAELGPDARWSPAFRLYLGGHLTPHASVCGQVALGAAELSYSPASLFSMELLLAPAAACPRACIRSERSVGGHGQKQGMPVHHHRPTQIQCSASVALASSLPDARWSLAFQLYMGGHLTPNASVCDQVALGAA